MSALIGWWWVIGIWIWDDQGFRFSMHSLKEELLFASTITIDLHAPLSNVFKEFAEDSGGPLKTWRFMYKGCNLKKWDGKLFLSFNEGW